MSEVPRHSRTLYSPADEYPTGRGAPRWSRERSRSLSSSRRSIKKTRVGMAKARIRKLRRWALKRVNSMTLAQKIVGSVVLLISASLGILTIAFHGQILHAMLPISQKLRSWKAGWLFIFALCFAAAFPPMIGYSTSVTLAGFVYGFPNGQVWFIVAGGTIVGATTAFMACRYLFRNFAKRMVATDKRFAALSLTLKHDGIKLLCMIRLCPLPYSISNGAMSTFPTVTPWAFMLATTLATPKLLIHVWIGDRLANLAKDDQKMDAKTKAVNWCSIVGGLLLGAILGWVIYTRTMARTRQLEAEEHSRIHAQHASRISFEDYVDEEPTSASSLIRGFIEGDELEASGMFTDLEEGDDEDDMGILLGDETDDDDGMIGMVERESMEQDDPEAPPK
ncbi:hypothetical protein EDC01DRAFT_625209 [Geopyxis carbonaria]|nr:hypothetical protein EDC01DRAFT_625209 [Geopyxis carbonaria]